MGAIKNLVTVILEDIDAGELTFEQIAAKHGVSLREVEEIAFSGDEGYELDAWHRENNERFGGYNYDELERDHDEPYEPEYPDPDSWYEGQYELEDF